MDISFDNTMDTKCGEVFLNSNGNLILVCTLCEIKYKEFQEYADHVLEKHLLFDVLEENLNETETDFATETETEIEDTTNSIQTDLEEEYKQLEDDSNFLMEEIEFLESIEPSLEDLEEYNVVMSSEKAMEKLYKSSPEKPTPIAVKQQIYRCAPQSSNEGSKTYYCSDCNKGFYSRSGYRSHLRTHTSEPKFHCNREKCGQSFMNFKDLKKHLEKCKYDCEMQCNECDLIFNDNFVFRKHMDLHERPFKCKECPVRMKTARGLERHMQVHGVRQEFICELCSNSFGDQNSLLEHLRTEHPGAPPVRVSIRQAKS